MEAVPLWLTTHLTSSSRKRKAEHSNTHANLNRIVKTQHNMFEWFKRCVCVSQLGQHQQWRGGDEDSGKQWQRGQHSGVQHGRLLEHGPEQLVQQVQTGGAEIQSGAGTKGKHVHTVAFNTVYLQYICRFIRLYDSLVFVFYIIYDLKPRLFEEEIIKRAVQLFFVCVCVLRVIWRSWFVWGRLSSRSPSPKIKL